MRRADKLLHDMDTAAGSINQRCRYCGQRRFSEKCGDVAQQTVCSTLLRSVGDLVLKMAGLMIAAELA
jgi:hypothetical protein